ncbi:hypothetical protein [Corallococcus exiguus]|uniref:Uncharacterized protein n=1 Tax=Corallococcus exiguus TaxID=83462 RepID=A0A7X5BXW0_9BACT|nr:hypothetical protein [Corallococcus exiguus]NBC45553.1 hypothetical protein [Corallococcus exiguus]TNV60401.1 hypothetical protein FH620_24455 [Corallococcus exiguus]
MTLRRKGTRSIVVDGTNYRWTVAPNDEPGLGIVVERESGGGQRMLTWVEHGTIIAPGLVRDAILYALESGWTPELPGAEWVFRRR